MALNGVMDFLTKYWWAILIAFGVIVFAILARKGLIGARLKSLFSWPPSP